MCNSRFQLRNFEREDLGSGHKGRATYYHDTSLTKITGGRSDLSTAAVHRTRPAAPPLRARPSKTRHPSHSRRRLRRRRAAAPAPAADAAAATAPCCCTATPCRPPSGTAALTTSSPRATPCGPSTCLAGAAARVRRSAGARRWMPYSGFCSRCRRCWTRCNSAPSRWWDTVWAPTCQVPRVHQTEPQARRPPRAVVAGRRAASRTATPRALLLAAAAEHCTTRRPARFSALCAQVSAPPHTPPSGETAIRPIIRFRGLRRAECARPIVEFLTVFDTPVRIVCGSHDSSIRVHDVFALYDRMKRMGFCVKMDVLEQCDHCPMLEQPDQFSAIMNSVMKSTRSSAF
ncbi:hydrolase alpha/beta fold family protein [Gracilaria domingensis]|nr:hydrolase alpha/beta fold family protein [Gracilaria domingensis]